VGKKKKVTVGVENYGEMGGDWFCKRGVAKACGNIAKYRKKLGKRPVGIETGKS